VSLRNDHSPLKLREVALKACEFIGRGLYGVDIKEINDDYVVVEVNDNPSIYAGFEDCRKKDVYKRIIAFLVD
jgi:glutathione synthase/RimK-type ligase-like ATP-grasp enzyme